MKRILFVSFLDFKEKSIQVIRNTPEAYRDHGWDVKYLVVRDNSKHDNYAYEEEFNPEGIEVFRLYLSLQKIIDFFSNRVIVRIINKIRYWIGIIHAFKKIIRLHREVQFDILYGYEFHGFLACKLALLFMRKNSCKVVARFQGTFFNEYFIQKKNLKILGNLDHLFALYISSDLCIMTDDGTQGDFALERIKSKHRANLLFLTNGVDRFPFESDPRRKINETLQIITVSRIVKWKRLDRVLSIASELINQQFYNFKITMIGDGPDAERIRGMIEAENLVDRIQMAGALPHSEIYQMLHKADVFLSFYDSSNVGNPLLEAIRANLIIFTLDNGDTGQWISHSQNGFIYNPDTDFKKDVAKDLIDLKDDSEFIYKIREAIKKTENKKLKTWKERFQIEIEAVEKVLKDNPPK